MTYDYRVAVARASITKAEALAIFGLTTAPSPEELKALYRKKSQSMHEDHSGDTRTSQLLNEAYDVLRGKAIPAKDKPGPKYDYRGGPEPGWGYKPPPSSGNPWDEAARRERAERAERAYRERAEAERRRRQERQDAEDRERARAESEKRKREEERAKANRSPSPVSKAVPREAVSRARARMYDAYDRAPGDATNKFNKMLIALKTRVRAITDPSKMAGVIEMLRQEVEEPEFNHRWSPAERDILKKIREVLAG